MVFIINNLKYDTDKMEEVCKGETWEKNLLVSEMCGKEMGRYVDSVLWRSKKGNYLLTFGNSVQTGRAISEEEAKSFLQKYSFKDYERLYGEIEEA